MRQKYLDAVEYFLGHRNEISEAWARPWNHEHGCLFMFLSSNGLCTDMLTCCPSMERHLDLTRKTMHVDQCSNQELHDYIQTLNLPLPFFNVPIITNQPDFTLPNQLTRNQLMAFALAQDKADDLIRNVPPDSVPTPETEEIEELVTA